MKLRFFSNTVPNLQHLIIFFFNKVVCYKFCKRVIPWKQGLHQRTKNCENIFWNRLASLGQLGLISDRQIGRSFIWMRLQGIAQDYLSWR